MKNYINIHSNFVSTEFSSLTFDPQNVHMIKTAPETYQIFGGALHAAVVKSAQQVTSNKISSVSTTFYNKSHSKETVNIEIKCLFEKKSISIYSVNVTQNEILLATSQVVTTPFDSPGDQSKFRIYVPQDFPDPYNWLWDTENESIFTILKSQISLSNGAINWFDGYNTDQSVLATLADYASIALVQYLGQMAKTVTMHSQFFGDFDSQKVLGQFEIVGFSPGSVSVKLNQYDLDGMPLCLTTLSCALLPLDPNMVNHFNKNYKPLPRH
jgi:hypothetical protein